MNARRLAAAAGIGTAVLLAGPHAAADPGHGGEEIEVVGALPTPNSTVTTRIDEAVVGFSGPLVNLGGHEMTVTGPDGERVDDGEVALAGEQALHVGLDGLKKQGLYTVRFKALAAGSQPSGTYRFTYAGPVGGALSTAQWAAGGTMPVCLAGLGALALRRLRSSR